MSLTPPKRLFHVPSMSTVITADVADDVRNKGYVAISHVWGNQRIYYTTELGIKNGVDWGILLSDPKKISRLVNAMEHHEKEYCWFDILCMPQDKQDEINLEIPFMGDYYSGADMTLVLSDENYVMSDDYIKWYDMMKDISMSEREITREEHEWMSTHESPILDFSREVWFTRVWTLQEALLSKKILLVSTNGCYFNMTNMFVEMANLETLGTMYMAKLFSHKSVFIIDLARTIKDINSMKNLKSMTSLIWQRSCSRDLDKYFGILGILGYKDFVVDYDIDIHSLAEEIIRYSYSNGDISWITVGRKDWSGFIQPMYIPGFISENWKEYQVGICGIKLLEKSLHINIAKYGVITHCKQVKHGGNDGYSTAFDILKNWKFSNEDAVNCVTQYAKSTEGSREIFCSLVDMNQGRITPDNIAIQWARLTDETHEHDPAEFVFDHSEMFTKDMNMAFKSIFVCRDNYPCTMVKVMCNHTNKSFPLMISGNAQVGDEIAFVKMRDVQGRILGFVISRNNRKGIFLYKEIQIKDELYKPHEFALWLPKYTNCCHIL